MEFRVYFFLGYKMSLKYHFKFLWLDIIICEFRVGCKTRFHACDLDRRIGVSHCLRVYCICNVFNRKFFFLGANVNDAWDILE